MTAVKDEIAPYPSNDRETGIHCVTFVDVKHKLWVLHHVDPESQRQGIVLPRVDHVLL